MWYNAISADKQIEIICRFTGEPGQLQQEKVNYLLKLAEQFKVTKIDDAKIVVPGEFKWEY